jgi:ABC-type amino acid transport substrate-binding protein
LVWQLGAALGVLALFAALLAALVRRAERRRQGTSGSLRWAAGGAWVLAAILLVSGFAVWSATTTVARKLAEDIRGPDDLPHVPVATVPGSTSAEYLKARDIEPRPVATPLDALRALVAGEIDAVVYDAPILKHIILSEGLVGKAVVLPGLFDPQDYAFALPDGSAIRTELNRHLVVRLQGDTWRRRLSQDLGEDR